MCACMSAIAIVPESPIMLAVGLHTSQVEPQILGDIQHIAEVQTDGVKEHRCHADLI